MTTIPAIHLPWFHWLVSGMKMQHLHRQTMKLYTVNESYKFSRQFYSIWNHNLLVISKRQDTLAKYPKIWPFQSFKNIVYSVYSDDVYNQSNSYQSSMTTAYSPTHLKFYTITVIGFVISEGKLIISDWSPKRFWASLMRKN